MDSISEARTNSAVYGPVNSWRLGRSLGIDVLGADSVCSFECVYCQLGKINHVTAERRVFVETADVLRDLQSSKWQTADVITFSGSGEPTLAANLGEIIREIKHLTAKPVVVLTNSTLLYLPEVRAELAAADQIFCKLDAWSNETLRRFDRPADGVSLERIVSGSRSLKREFIGTVAIQTMLLRRPERFELEKYAEIVNLIAPDEVQLNIPTRPIPPKYFVEARGNEIVSTAEFKKLKTITNEELAAVSEELRRLTAVPLTKKRV